jgi:RNA-directed DNA polymerase
MNTALPMYEWKDVPWRAIERRVYKLQKRIYQASSRGDAKAVRRLQRLLMHSRSARYLAVRRVTQDNRGKKTAGVDGVRELTPEQRLNLAEEIRVKPEAHPVRRVWIPKPGKVEKRPLGIPTMRDRAAQGLVKLALEPEWEARFEPNSYGFRPGRSCHDAIEAIWGAIKDKPKHVLDADITKCFDRINHQALLNKLNTSPSLRRVIRAWLRAGVMDGPELFPTEEGTPQGGVISPLLANIALHGLETAITYAYPKQNRELLSWRPRVIRYADDFVVLHTDANVIEEIREQAAAWLADIGLELSPSKTRIGHTLDGEQPGFDFLGFTIRQLRVGKYRTGKHALFGRPAEPLGFKTIIRPSKDAVKRQLTKVADVIQKRKAATQQELIAELNPVIQGWARYYAMACSGRTFGTMDHLVYIKLHRWAVRRHPQKNKNWIANKYWRTERGSWEFAPRNGQALREYKETHIERHVKVRGNASVFDGNWVYWASRLGRHPEHPRSITLLLQRQRGKCGWCGLYLKDTDILERDHVQPLVLGGEWSYTNQMVLHGHCHDSKTAQDGSLRPRGTH